MIIAENRVNVIMQQRLNKEQIKQSIKNLKV